MYISIAKNRTPVIDGLRCVPEMRLLPYIHMEGKSGNFAFQTIGDELPWWENFGVDHFLLYASRSEIAAIRLAYLAGYAARLREAIGIIDNAVWIPPPVPVPPWTQEDGTTQVYQEDGTIATEEKVGL